MDVVSINAKPKRILVISRDVLHELRKASLRLRMIQSEVSLRKGQFRPLPLVFRIRCDITVSRPGVTA